MKPRKKKNTNNKSASSKPETKATTNVEASTNNEQQTNKEVMQKSTSSETGGSTGTSNTGSRRNSNSSSSSNTSSNEDVKISEKKPTVVKVHNSTTSTSSSLSSEENSSSKIKNETALTKSQSNSPTNNHTADSISETNTTKISKSNSSSGTKKVSELVTIRIPTVHQSLVEQKPPLPPQSSQSRLANNNNSNNNNNNKREAEKSRSIQPIARSMSNAQQVAVDSRSVSKPRTEKTVYKSNSLKALFIRNPNDKERVDQMIQHKQTPNSNRITASVLMVDKKHSTSISQQMLVDPNASIQKILVDLVNMQKVNETPKKKSEPKSSASRVILVNPSQQAAPLDRTLRQGGAGGASQQSQQPKATSSTSTSTSESEVVVKKYKKLAPTPDNTKKLVVQVLRDLVTLYKTDKEAFNGVGDVSSTPKTPTTSPVEQQQLNNKKPPKPVEIKIRKVDDKLIIKSNQPVVINTEPCDDQKQPAQIQNEYKLKMSSSAESCNVSQQLAKTNSLGNVTAVKRVRYLGVVDADPAEYLRRYKDELLPADKLPDFIKQVKPPSNLKLAADLGPSRPYELEGDIEVFRHINLEKVGMTEYKEFLASKGIQTKSTQSGCELVKTTDAKLSEQIEGLFKTLDTNNDGLIGSHDAERLLLKLNSTYNRNYGENESKAFFNYLSASNKDQSQVDLKTFKKAFGLE